MQALVVGASRVGKTSFVASTSLATLFPNVVETSSINEAFEHVERSHLLVAVYNGTNDKSLWALITHWRSLLLARNAFFAPNARPALVFVATHADLIVNMARELSATIEHDATEMARVYTADLHLVVNASAGHANMRAFEIVRRHFRTNRRRYARLTKAIADEACRRRRVHSAVAVHTEYAERTSFDVWPNDDE